MAYSDKTAAEMPIASQLISLLNEKMPKILTQEKAVNLEMELNSEDEDVAKKARQKALQLLNTLITKKTDMSVLMSIKLHADIFKPKDYPEHSPFIIFGNGEFALDYYRANTPEAYKKEISDIGRRKIACFIKAYSEALSHSDIKALPTKSSFETAKRKLTFIRREISQLPDLQYLITACEDVSRLLPKAKYSYDYVMLSIIDLHYKTTATPSEKRQIKDVITKWNEMLNWDTEHLKKHARKPQQFFLRAHLTIQKKLRLLSYKMNKTASILDIVEALDKYSKYRYLPSKRKELIDEIEKDWREWKRKFQLNTKPASNSKPKKKTYFKVNLTCHALLTDGTINKTQPLSIKTVIEFLSSNSKAALKDYQPCSDTPPTKDADLKPIAVHIDKATSNKVKTLQKRFKFSAVHHLLEFAVKYYEQNKGKPVASPEQNASNHKQKPEPSHNSTPSEAVAGEQLPDTNQAAKPNETEEQTNPSNDAQHAENTLQAHKTCPLVFSMKTILLLQNPELAFRPPSAISNLVIASVEDNSKTSDQQTQRATPLRCSPPKD